MLSRVKLPSVHHNSKSFLFLFFKKEALA